MAELRAMADLSPAEERAVREGLDVVLLLPMEAMRIVAGNPNIVRTSHGTEVLVRLYTADEFHAAHHRMAAECGFDGISHATAEELTRPMRVQP